ncbi:3-isopropylmalate dehydratase, small subunit [Actinopolyspora lacussalsi subsp. righensis]|uniref:3-isopropylmalate dehydratase small subunit n=1 Tax=Actinopolyspora righensis TaxID=995060 RepID=A0A1I7CG15_9ACTN|nr:3-isopropylmalate dehydratase small subunit [Actinopolyspora righensis]SFT98322.1 3-isopropylmalate dehydratase, small subunit [Actinopolyspora righensis]
MNPEPICGHSGTAVPLRRGSVDTDQIIPAEFCKRLGRTGYSDALFNRWREEPDFVLNRAEFSDATVLVAGTDFGIGSSREHAVWALRDFGFRAVIAHGFGDIFRNNATKNQLITANVSEEAVKWLWDLLDTEPASQVSVDLEKRLVTAGEGEVHFEIDDYSRWQLINELDDIQITLRRGESIDRYERNRRHWLPGVSGRV